MKHVATTGLYDSWTQSALCRVAARAEEKQVIAAKLEHHRIRYRPTQVATVCMQLQSPLRGTPAWFSQLDITAQ